jgi:hypothetical protein
MHVRAEALEFPASTGLSKAILQRINIRFVSSSYAPSESIAVVFHIEPMRSPHFMRDSRGLNAQLSQNLVQVSMETLESANKTDMGIQEINLRTTVAIPAFQFLSRRHQRAGQS